MYVARRDKALGFAKRSDRHGGSAGGLVTAIVSFSFPKFVSADDDTWQEDGYDACRTSETSRSFNMEWCLKEPSQLHVLEIEHVPLEDNVHVHGRHHRWTVLRLGLSFWNLVRLNFGFRVAGTFIPVRGDG